MVDHLPSGGYPPNVVRTHRTIRNCAVRLKVVCPKIWDDLQATGDADVRHCAQCDQDVHYCRTDAETLAHGRAGHCVAREEPDRSELPKLVLGRPAVPVEVTEQQAVAQRRSAREHGISRLLNGRLEGTSRECPECAWPVPDFRVRCYVCGAHVGRA